MSTFTYPPAYMSPGEADAFIRAKCDDLGLDPDKVLRDLRTGGTMVRVALMGEEAQTVHGWPPAHVQVAKKHYAAATA